MYLVLKERINVAPFQVTTLEDDEIQKIYEADQAGYVTVRGDSPEESIDNLREVVDTDLPDDETHITGGYFRCLMCHPQGILMTSSEEVISKARENACIPLRVTRCSLHESIYEEEDIVINHELNYSIIEYNPAKYRSKRKAPEYAKTTKKRYGRIGIQWFSSYATIIRNAVGLDMSWLRGWGQWSSAHMNFVDTHNTFLGWPSEMKRRIRQQESWFKLMERASHYIDGAKRHKIGWLKDWACHMEQECEWLGIEIPSYQKKGKDNDA